MVFEITTITKLDRSLINYCTVLFTLWSVDGVDILGKIHYIWISS